MIRTTESRTVSRMMTLIDVDVELTPGWTVVDGLLELTEDVDLMKRHS